MIEIKFKHNKNTSSCQLYTQFYNGIKGKNSG